MGFFSKKKKKEKNDVPPKVVNQIQSNNLVTIPKVDRNVICDRFAQEMVEALKATTTEKRHQFEEKTNLTRLQNQKLQTVETEANSSVTQSKKEIQSGQHLFIIAIIAVIAVTIVYIFFAFLSIVLSIIIAFSSAVLLSVIFFPQTRQILAAVNSAADEVAFFNSSITSRCPQVFS